jgi:hypothetical protein
MNDCLLLPFKTNVVTSAIQRKNLEVYAINGRKPALSAFQHFFHNFILPDKPFYAKKIPDPGRPFRLEQ